jgi:hypothetical protein
MKRLWLLLCALLLCVGCTADGDKAQWDEFWKDVRGENMQMRGSFSSSSEGDNNTTQTKPRTSTP